MTGRRSIAVLSLFFAQVCAASTDIAGVVKSPKGPEAGVWVIAETTDLPTRFARIVVTDEQGRYLVPGLPKANYSVWVRGYGLVDSPKMRAIPGQKLDLVAVPAPDARSAAQYYPAIYWYSMMRIPEASQFGGKTSIPKQITRPEWLTVVKNRSCVGCHQLGQASTRTIPAELAHITPSDQAWIRRVQSGQAANSMILPLAGHLGGAPFKYFSEWTDRVAKGELPHAKPPRPQGVERNIVVTWWEWGEPRKYLHDLIASDRRYPNVNANGLLFGSPEYSTDNIPILDPQTHKVSFYKLPVRDADTPEALGPGHAAMEKPMQPSPYWGEEKIWDSRANNHNSMFDRQGRVWMAAAIRGPNNPDFCKKGSEHPSAKVFPLERTNRHVSVLDPKTMKTAFVDTCFGSHHLQFDAQDRLWTSGAPVAGWVDTRLFDQTGDAARSQGWSPFVLDTNGNGRRDEWIEPNPAARSEERQTDRRRFLRRRLQSRRRQHRGLVDRIPRFAGADQPGPGPLEHRAFRSVRIPRAHERLGRSRHGHRPQRRRVVVARKRASRELRSPQMQSSAERPESDRQTLPRRLGALSVSRTAVPEREDERQR